LPTLMLGCLPGYSTIGFFAPAMVILIRFAQAFAVGGQLVGALVYAAENAPPNRKALYTAVALAGANAGALLGSIVAVTIRVIIGNDNLAAWGWRLPFIIGFLMSVFAYLVQRGLRKEPSEEEDVTEAEAELPEPEPSPGCCALIAEFPCHIFCVLCVYGIWCGSFYMAYFFMPNYLKLEGFDPRGTFAVSLLGMTILVGSSPVIGYYIDKYDDSEADADETREPNIKDEASLFCCKTKYRGSIRQWRRFQVLLISAILQVCFAPFSLALKLSLGWIAIVPCSIIEALLQSMIGGSISAWMVGLFPKAKVYSAMAIGLNGATVIFGGTAPVVCTALSEANKVAPSGFLMTCGLAGILGIYLAAGLFLTEPDYGEQAHVAVEMDEEVDELNPGSAIAGQVPAK